MAKISFFGADGEEKSYTLHPQLTLRVGRDPGNDVVLRLDMADMERASTRLVGALRDGEHIVVSGDYDTDGITGTALLVSELRRLGGRVDFFIPDRERDGYGVTPRLVQRAGEVGVRVLVSVDCGSSDHAAIELARGLGIDVIVVDHHEIPHLPAAAFAVLNPKRADCAYPFRGLSAVGVAYKLLQAVCKRVGPTSAPEDGLDLVALGTMGDVQPLVQGDPLQRAHRRRGAGGKLSGGDGRATVRPVAGRSAGRFGSRPSGNLCARGRDAGRAGRAAGARRDDSRRARPGCAADRRRCDHAPSRSRPRP